MRDTLKMLKFYRAILWEIAICYDINPNDIHEVLKCWYKIQSTWKLTFEERKEYLENIIYFVMVVFNMSFDSEWYKQDWISRVRMYWAMRPDNFKSLF